MFLCPVNKENNGWFINGEERKRWISKYMEQPIPVMWAALESHNEIGSSLHGYQGHCLFPSLFIYTAKKIKLLWHGREICYPKIWLGQNYSCPICSLSPFLLGSVITGKSYMPLSALHTGSASNIYFGEKIPAGDVCKFHGPSRPVFVNCSWSHSRGKNYLLCGVLSNSFSWRPKGSSCQEAL